MIYLDTFQVGFALEHTKKRGGELRDTNFSIVRICFCSGVFPSILRAFAEWEPMAAIRNGFWVDYIIWEMR